MRMLIAAPGRMYDSISGEPAEMPHSAHNCTINKSCTRLSTNRPKKPSRSRFTKSG